MSTSPVAPCYLWPATNNNTPACSWWSGPGLLYIMSGALRGAVGRFRAWEYKTLTDIKTALRACKWPLRRFCFFASPLPRWTRAQKCRLRASGRPTSGEKLLEGIGNMGKRKPAPGKPRAGAGGIQDFFAVSQIIMIGRAKINRIIKRGSPPPTFCPYGAQNNNLRRSPLWCLLSGANHAPKIP